MATELRDSKREFTAKSGVIRQIQAGSGRCRLCLEEKLLILNEPIAVVPAVVIARSLELMPPHGQKSGVREAGVMVVYVLYTWGI